MLRKGLPQRRQSAGKSVAKSAVATPLTPEANAENTEPSRVTAVVLVARVGVTLLLKTILPRPVAVPGGVQLDESLSV
jgi:hypothetical protein